MDTYIAYIDFTKCFDLINRNILFYKLTEYGFDGKMYQTLKKMYSQTWLIRTWIVRIYTNPDINGWEQICLLLKQC